MRRFYENRKRTGKFVVVDGIDGVGKGVFLDTFVEEAKKDRKKVFDVNEFWKQNEVNPRINNIIGKFDVVLTSEPTFMGVGKIIRDELIAENKKYLPLGKFYPAGMTALAYSIDRRVLYGELILPLLQAGVDVYQSRSFSTSLTYQVQDAQDKGENLTINDVLALSGNQYCMRYPMNHLVIPTIQDVEEAVKRSQSREKQDNCQFEKLDFQLKLKERYDSAEFKKIFKGLDVPLTYLDAGVSIEYSKQQAREFYMKKLR